MKHPARMGTVIVLVLVPLILVMSCAHTKNPKDATGAAIKLQVDSIETVKINGTRQTIYLAGMLRTNPVLLWLDGGPGGSEVGWVRTYLGPLHEQFTVVCWDQRGTAASYLAGKDDLSVERFVEDVIAMSKLLARKFNQDKIFLVGHSWGSVIGLKAAKAAPELFHAYIGAAQQVNVIENDTMGYEMILRGALASGDRKTVRTLTQFGKPPYHKTLSDGTVIPDGEAYYALLSRLYRYSPPAPADRGFQSMKMFLAPEHNLISKMNLIRGVIRGVKTIYPQLESLDFEQEVTKLDCPLFLVTGRYDMSCVASLSERWFTQVSAPQKEFLWLEKSGHNGVYTEADRFMCFMMESVRPLSDLDGDLDDLGL